MAKDVSLMLSRDQALILHAWLARSSVAGEPVSFADQAEQRVLWDLEATLEEFLTEPLDAGYLARLSEARLRVRDVEE